MAQNIMQGTRFEDHGTRSEIEAIAQQGGVSLTPGGAGPGPGGPLVAPPPPGGGLSVPSPVDALQQMPTDQAPVTSGLSVGPGNTPLMEAEAAKAQALSREQKLVALATMAKSPHIRAQAANALRLMIARLNSKGSDAG